MKCSVCKDTKEVFRCDACEEGVCKSCMSLTSSEIKVLQLNNRVMKLYCEQCNRVQTCPLLQEIIRAKEELIESKNGIIADKEKMLTVKDEIISMLRKEIEMLKSENPLGNCKTGYSEAVKKSKTEVLVVKPKKAKQDSSMTKQVVEEKVNPSTLGVGIARMRYVREGGLAISCRGDKDVQSVSEIVRQELGGDYEVKIPTKKNPKIKIFNVDEKLLVDSEEFIEKMITQNIINTPPPQRVLKIIEHYKDKKGRTNIIVELDPITYGKIEKKEVLYIGWRTCRFINHINIIQCYQCWKFGHFAKNCKKVESTCPRCSGKHRSNECTSDEEACVNCKYAAEVLRIPNIDYHHTAISKKCVAYKRIYEQLEQRVNYPDIYGTATQ